MNTKEYIAEVMMDGHLSLPEKIAQELGLKPHAKVKVTIEKSDQEEQRRILSSRSKRKALAIRKFITDMGPEDLSENFRERYK